jgi:hypothetical protein
VGQGLGLYTREVHGRYADWGEESVACKYRRATLSWFVAEIGFTDSEGASRSTESDRARPKAACRALDDLARERPWMRLRDAVHANHRGETRRRAACRSR